MTVKDKIILVILSIITLGIYPSFVFVKKTKKISNKLSVNEKIMVNLVSLKKALGEEKNILGIEYTHTKIKIFIKDKQIVNVDAIQNLKGISGVFASSGFVTIIVGKNAKKISENL